MTPDTQQPEIVILLPAYNEGENIGPLLLRIKEALTGASYRVLLVDDGSRDGTGEAAEKLAAAIPLTLLRHETNKGLALALETGISFACAQFPEAKLLVTMDSDGSHDPGLIRSIVSQVENGAEIVIASRFAPGGGEQGVPRLRKLLSRGAGFLLRIAFNLKGVRDYTSGYRGYKMSLLHKALKAYTPLISSVGFSVTPELLLKLHRLAGKTVEIPLLLRYDLKKGKSKAKILRTIFQYLGMIWKLRGLRH